MNDDYLWDRSGPPDPEIARLEELLRPFGHDDTASVAIPRAQPVKGRAMLVSLATAAVLALAVGGWWLIGRSAPSWEVTMLDGAPSAPSRRVTGTRDLPVGGWLETGPEERAFVKVADIGNVNVDPRTRVRLIRTRAGEHRLELAHGTLHATILAPPGQFFVETPSAVVVDLGCAYTLTIDEGGAGLVSVTLGWVGFEWRGRESFIPAGFRGATRPGVGPGTPYYMDSAAPVIAALDTIDFAPGSPEAVAAIDVVLAAAGERDEATLWHLLSRVAVDERDRVFDRLAQFVPPPTGVTRDGIRAGRREMLDQWWDALGLGTVSWWRQWTRTTRR